VLTSLVKIVLVMSESVAVVEGSELVGSALADEVNEASTLLAAEERDSNTEEMADESADEEKEELSSP